MSYRIYLSDIDAKSYPCSRRWQHAGRKDCNRIVSSGRFRCYEEPSSLLYEVCRIVSSLLSILVSLASRISPILLAGHLPKSEIEV